MRGLIYGVLNILTNEIEKVGSTTQKLNVREAAYRNSEKWFSRNHKLVLLREVFHRDRKFFQILLFVIEAFEIGRRKCWINQRGRNIACPVLPCIGMGLLFSEIGRLGGKSSWAKSRYKHELYRKQKKASISYWNSVLAEASRVRVKQEAGPHTIYEEIFLAAVFESGVYQPFRRALHFV